MAQRGKTFCQGGILLFTLSVLMILFVFVLSLLLIFKLGERTFFKVMAGKEALNMAKAGLEQAIWELDHDNQEFDSYLDNWRTVFSGDQVDSDEDGIPDSRWFLVQDRHGRILGRYAVLVEDENSKIDLNAVGNLTGSFNEGHSVAEISLLPHIFGKSLACQIISFRYGPDGKPGKPEIDDDRDNILVSSDGIDNDGDGLVDEEGEGIDEPDEFSLRRPRGGDRPYIIPEDLKLVPGCGEGKFSKVRPWITCYSIDFNENRKKVKRLNINQASWEDFFHLFQSLGYEKLHAAALAANCVDFRDEDSIPTVVEVDKHKVIGQEKVAAFNEVEAIVPFEIKEVPVGLLITEKAGQFIELFNPYSSDLDIGGWKITGLLTIPTQILDILLKESSSIYEDITRGETEVDAGRLKNILESLNPTAVVIPSGTTIKAHSYYTIGDLVKLALVVPASGTPILLVLPIRDPDNCQQYEAILLMSPVGSDTVSRVLRSLPFLKKLNLDGILRLYDSDGHLIEEACYGLDTPFTTAQKNDPRMKAWFPLVSSPGEQNLAFQPWVGGEFGKMGWLQLWGSSFFIKNKPFATTGEISFIHRNQQWRTLDFWKTGEDRKILDEITVVRKPEIPTPGRLNINTASETVLLCLPLFSEKLACCLLKARPFRDISEILGVYGSDCSPEGELNKEITGFGFDLLDNNGNGYIDEEQEKELIFSRVIGLVTVRSNIFSLTVTGQKVSDTNNNGKIEEKEVLAEKKIRVVYDRRRQKILFRKQL